MIEIYYAGDSMYLVYQPVEDKTKIEAERSGIYVNNKCKTIGYQYFVKGSEIDSIVPDWRRYYKKGGE